MNWDDFDWPGILGKVVGAIIILLVTWIVAKLAKKAFGKLVERVPALRKVDGNGQDIGSSLGQIASLLIWLFGLVALLALFQLDSALQPVQSLLTGVTAFLPKLIGAGLVFVIGAILAKVVRQLIETALGAVPFDNWLNKAKGAENAVTAEATGVDAPTPPAGNAVSEPIGPRIASVLGTIAYALILIVVTISALQILGIQSISRPAEQMLNTIFDTIPAVVAALLLLALGGLIAKFTADILGQILNGFGLDSTLTKAEILPEGKSATPVITKVVQVAIVLFFAVMAAQTLEFPQITSFLSEVLSLGGRVVFGAAIIAAGVFVANLLAKVLSGQGGTATVVKIATIVLFTAMGLKYMGIADSIIELAFGALVVGGAAAAALAFGLGGRDAAAKQLEKVQSKADQS
ncbi:mechanosensitive ion channel [Dermacoccaceae bacterium W4C1]